MCSTGQCDLWLSSPDSVISGMLLVGVSGVLCWERSGQCDLLDGVISGRCDLLDSVISGSAPRTV